MCEFNNDVLAAVREVERAGGATGLTGCYDAEWLCTDAITTASHAMPIKVGLVTFFPKETDPCATKRQILWAPKQIEMCTGLSADGTSLDVFGVAQPISVTECVRLNVHYRPSGHNPQFRRRFPLVWMTYRPGLPRLCARNRTAPVLRLPCRDRTHHRTGGPCLGSATHATASGDHACQIAHELEQASPASFGRPHIYAGYDPRILPVAGRSLS